MTMEWALVEKACISEMLKNSKFVLKKKAFLELYTFLNTVFCHKPLSITYIIWNGLIAEYWLLWELHFLANLVSNDPQMKWMFTVACVAMIPKEAAKCVSTTDCDEMTNNASGILCFWFLLNHSNKQQYSVYTLYFSRKWRTYKWLNYLWCLHMINWYQQRDRLTLFIFIFIIWSISCHFF